MSLSTPSTDFKLTAMPDVLPLPLPLPKPLAELDDVVRPDIIGHASAADTPASEALSPGLTPATPGSLAYKPTKKFVSTPYPEKKGWLGDSDGDEVDSTEGNKYIASDEESASNEEDDYFESEADKLKREDSHQA